MFRVSLGELFELYLSILVGLTFGAWLLFHWRRRRREIQAWRQVLECGLCGHRFQDPSEQAITRCPSCDKLTERRRPLRL